MIFKKINKKIETLFEIIFVEYFPTAIAIIIISNIVMIFISFISIYRSV